MSIYSGKCDVFDVFIAIGNVDDINTDWNKITINKYINDLDLEGCKKIEELNIKSVKELVPYFPFLEVSSVSFEGFHKCIISEFSFVDIEEKDILNRALKRAKSYYRKCKRNKIDFNVDEAAKKISFCKHPDDNTYEICRRVKEHPCIANVDGLHTNLHNHFRIMLYEEMLKYGYTKEQAYEWVYNKKKTW